MTATFDGKLQFSVNGVLSETIDMLTSTSPLSWSPNYVLTNGSGANQANQMFTDIRTLTASSTEDIDLSGVLVNSLGTTLAFTSIKAMFVQADTANVNDITLGGHATAAVTSFFGAAAHKIKLKPGGMIAFVAPDASGYGVTATTADMLTVINISGVASATYKIVLIGVV